jgi:pimeloyl-ACP methyl ester carboxylesterase
MIRWVMTQSATDLGSSAPPLGRLYDVAGRQLWLHRSGDGGPAVVVLPGAGAVGLDYLNIQKRTSRFTTCVLYDRGGTGLSGSAQSDRSAAATTDELRSLLSSAGVKPPYLFVAHSLGGLFARRYAQRFPQEVAGLVLLDPAHEDYDAYMPPRLNAMRASGSIARLIGGLSGFALGAAVRVTPGLVERMPIVRHYRDLYRRLFAQEMMDWPASLRAGLVERHVSLQWLWAGIREAQNAPRLYREVRAGGATPDVRMIILCSMGIDDFRRAVSVGESGELMVEELAGKRRLYEALAATATPGEVRLVDAGHVTISFRHPEAVEQAVADVLGAGFRDVRDESGLPRTGKDCGIAANRR